MLLPLVIALIPLLIAPGLLFFYDVTPKVVLLLLGVAVALPWFSPGKLMERREGRWLCGLLAAQAASLILSTALSTRVSSSVFGTDWRRFGLITQAAILLFTVISAADLAGSRDRLRLYLRAVALAAIPISAYGIAQYFGWDPWISRQAYHAGEGIWTIVRPPGTLGYVSYFANYLVLAIFLACALHAMEENGWWKRAGALAATLGAVAIVLSGTRAAMLGSLLGAAYLWLRFRRLFRLRGIAIAGASLAAAALFALSPAGQMLRSRIHWTIEEPLGGARLLLYRDSLALAARHPVAGIGPETFAATLPGVQSMALSQAYPDFYHESPHNILLDALTAQGIVGAFVLAGLIALGFGAARKSRTEDTRLAGILGAGLLASAVAHQFAVFTAPTALYFYLTVAMLVATTRKTGESIWPIWLPGGTVTKVIVTAAVSGVFLIGGIRLLVADWKLQSVKNLIKTGDRAGATLEYSRVRSWGLNADVWYSNQMATAALKAPNAVESLKTWQQAIEAGVRATKTADDPHNAWYSLAALHARQNDFDPTEACLRQAIASSPTWFKPHWMLAQILFNRGRREEAKAEADLAARLNGGKNPEVIQTLGQILAGQ